MATEVPSRKRLAAHHASAESISEGAGLPRQPTKNSDGPELEALGTCPDNRFHRDLGHVPTVASRQVLDESRLLAILL